MLRFSNKCIVNEIYSIDLQRKPKCLYIMQNISFLRDAKIFKAFPVWRYKPRICDMKQQKILLYNIHVCTLISLQIYILRDHNIHKCLGQLGCFHNNLMSTSFCERKEIKPYRFCS